MKKLKQLVYGYMICYVNIHPSLEIKLGLAIFFLVISTRVLAVADNALGIKNDEVTASLYHHVSPHFRQRSAITEALGWQRDCQENEYCCGCYVDPQDVLEHPYPAAIRDKPMQITTSSPVLFTSEGTSVVQGKIKLTQPGRVFAADHATFVRDNKIGKISSGFLSGHVSFREYGKLFVAERGKLDFTKGVYQLQQGIYRLSNKTVAGITNVWGQVKHAINDAEGIMTLKNATYSSCPPDATAWYLQGNTIILNRNTGRGEAYNASLFLQNIPVFYTPYINFPIDKRRQSGFLLPTISYKNQSGLGIHLPYYFNLAPNYDLTFTSRLFLQRGVMFDGLGRYLTDSSRGSVNLSFIPYDHKLVKLRDSVAAVSSTSSDYRAIKALHNSTSYRGKLNIKNTSLFDKHWSTLIDINYVSDDNYLQDFSNISTVPDNDQLLNRADINYEGQYWHFLGRVQLFQTLHPYNYTLTQDQYHRIPQINLSGDFPEGWGGLHYKLDTEIVNFMHRDESSDYQGRNIVGGSRLYCMPGVSTTLHWVAGTVVPRLQFHMVGYNQYDQNTTQIPSTLGRVIPIISLDSNIGLRREYKYLTKTYIQTLEPRIFYLFVPVIKQDTLPVFDTFLPAFDINQLFRTNRFNGIDRVGDANQVALSITSRLLDEYGQEKISLAIGGGVVLWRHQVAIENASSTSNVTNFNRDPLRYENITPLVGNFQYTLNSKIKSTMNVAWDVKRGVLNTFDINWQYLHDDARVINFWYRYAIDGDQWLQSKAIALNRIGCSAGWKLGKGWYIIGNSQYNISYSRMQNYMYGLEYQGCCWALRAVQAYDLISKGADGSTKYSTKFYIQFLLRGLGNVDVGGGGMALADHVSGYRDKFVTGV